jgi:hypothetical protein
MRREAHFVQNEIVKSEWTDELVCALTEQEWRRASAAAPADGCPRGTSLPLRYRFRRISAIGLRTGPRSG